jgi:hypothetical protein
LFLGVAKEPLLTPEDFLLFEEYLFEEYLFEEYLVELLPDENLSE